MSQFEQYCGRCGQGKNMFTYKGICPMCNYNRVVYVEKKTIPVEKIGIKELLDN